MIPGFQGTIPAFQSAIPFFQKRGKFEPGKIWVPFPILMSNSTLFSYSNSYKLFKTYEQGMWDFEDWTTLI